MGSDLDLAIAVDSNNNNNNNIHLVGYHSETVDFDPDPINEFWMTSAGSSNAFLLALNQS